MTGRFGPGAFLAGVSLALLASCARQAEPPAALRPPPATLAQLDADHDGDIDREEWVGHGDKVFRELDGDADGEVSAEEMANGFDAFDANKDGVLTPDEIAIASFDKNADGVVTREEWDGAVAQSGLDRNHDGVVTRAEIRATREDHFSTLDSNADGYASRIELSRDAPSLTLFRF